MYNYVGSCLKKLGPRGRWFTQNVAHARMCDLITNFSEVCIVLNNPLYATPLGVYLHEIAYQFNLTHDPSTLTEWLSNLGNTALPTTESIPSLEVTYATYADAFQAGFSISLVQPNINPLISSVLPKENRDLRITKEVIDYRNLFDTSLITVNGIFHRTNFVGDALHVLEGGHNSTYCNQHHVGLYSLGNLGKIITAPICDRLITPESPTQPLRDRVVLEIDPRVGSIEDKSILLSIGGYLHLPDDKLIRRSGERTYTVSIADYPLVARFFELREFIDLSNIIKHLTKSTVNPNQIVVEELYSDVALRALFTLSQSFFVIVDTPELWLEKTLVEWNQLPGSYISHEKPIYPLMTNLGKFNEYWAKYERDRYVISIANSYKSNYLFETTPWKDQTSVDNSRVPDLLLSKNETFYFKLGKNVS
jgi:hypothetical protein